MMVSNRRNFIFRVSIVINIAVLLYAAMQLSGGGPPGVEWVPMTAGASEVRFLRDERNDSDTVPQETSLRGLEESTSQKTPSTMPTTNKTASSTASIMDREKRLSISSPSEIEPSVSEQSLESVLDENVVSDAAAWKLRTLLSCQERDYERQTLQRGDYWVLKNYVRADHGPLLCHETITYTTHAGFEFLDNVPPLVQRWKGPVSVAVHAPGADFGPTVNSIRYLRDCIGSDLIKQYVTFHIFFSFKHVPNTIPDPEKLLSTPYKCEGDPPYVVNASTTYMKEKNLLYPVNVARNIARDAALTYFILPSDIELYPSLNLIPRFMNMIARNAPPVNTSTNPRVFPLSIFEVDAKVQVPSSKAELQTMLTNKSAIPFHKFVCPDCHNIPQGQQWMTAKETNQMDVFHVGKRHGKFQHWEPIYIGTHQDPYYDERLSWEGKKDKMTQGYILCVKNYDFMILNNAFLTHKPGIKHYARNPVRDALAGKQNAYVKNHIMPELKKLFGTKTGCAI